RRDGEAIYDPVGKRIIIFGGSSNTGLKNDTWAFDPNSKIWTKLNTVGAPPSARLGFDAVYDPIEQQMVIYSGQGAGFFNDTWTLNLTTLEWKDVSPATDSARPKRRYGSAAIFDRMTRSLVSFAGFTSEAGRFQDTQSFGLAANGWTDWTPTGIKPQIRCLLTAAFDRAGRRMIIYGGQRNGPLDDIWAFDLAARQWTNLTPAIRPAGRMWASSFVNKDGHFMLFGGSGNGNYNETWEFDLASQQWTQLQIDNPPPARNAALGAYIEGEDRFIIFGGSGNSGLFSDVWELSRKSAPTVTTVSTVSAASFDGALLAPESIVAAFGTNLATATQIAGTTPLPTALAGTTIKLKDNAGIDRTASLFFVSPTQANYLIPASISVGPATVTVTSGDGSTATGTVQIANVAPSLFTANASGQGLAAAVALRVRGNGLQITEPVAQWDAVLNRFIAKPIDLSPNAADASEQIYLVLFGTGIRYRSGLSQVSIRIGGTDASVLYAGAQNDFVGLDQVNVLLPQSLAGRGEVEVMLTADGKTANTVKVSIK
ncbi:MAG: hypothetical protein M3X11_25500, partial [Acidobacteriota bacterium]|nr:hypothetical protein [Acidobacteriota bacterium]